jgi:hypothetical protein
MANRYARPPKSHDEDNDFEEALNESPERIAERHLVAMPTLGRPYETDEEKADVYALLARLKENRKTNQECADILCVSKRTVANYLIDPYYAEVEASLIHEAKRRGHLQISDVIDDSVNKLYSLMNTARSEFVQYKSAEYLLKISGYENEVQERERDNQADVIKFLSGLDRRKGVPVQVNVTVNQSPSSEPSESPHIDSTLVSSSSSILGERSIMEVGEDEELAQYLRPMLPGGKLPKDEETE